MDKAPIAGGKGGVVLESPAANGFQGFHIKKKVISAHFLIEKIHTGVPCSECSYCYSVQKYFSSSCLKAEAGLK